MNEAAVEVYPELRYVFFSVFEGFHDFVYYVKAFLWMTVVHFFAEHCFWSHEDSFFGHVEVAYGVVCVDERYVHGKRSKYAIELRFCERSRVEL